MIILTITTTSKLNIAPSTNITKKLNMIIDILPALKDGDSYRVKTQLSLITSVGSCFHEAA